MQIIEIFISKMEAKVYEKENMLIFTYILDQCQVFQIS